MPDKFDRYREALVVETNTAGLPSTRAWTQPRGGGSSSVARGSEELWPLEYVRLHTGFCRRSPVTAEDLKRIRG